MVPLNWTRCFPSSPVGLNQAPRDRRVISSKPAPIKAAASKPQLVHARKSKKSMLLSNIRTPSPTKPHANRLRRRPWFSISCRSCVSSAPGVTSAAVRGGDYAEGVKTARARYATRPAPPKQRLNTTKPTRTSVASMSKYSATPPATPNSFLSLLLTKRLAMPVPRYGGFYKRSDLAYFVEEHR